MKILSGDHITFVDSLGVVHGATLVPYNKYGCYNPDAKLYSVRFDDFDYASHMKKGYQGFHWVHESRVQKD